MVDFLNLPSKEVIESQNCILQSIADKLGVTTGALEDAINLANAAGANAEAKALDVENRFQQLTASQQQDAEIIDARQGNISLGSNLTKMKNEFATYREEADKKQSTLIKRYKRRPIITWIDDDGLKEVYDRIKPLVEDYNIPITSCLMTNKIGVNARFLTWDQVVELKNIGMEFMSHGHILDLDNQPKDMTFEELDADFATSKKVLAEHGIYNRGIVFPMKQYTDNMRRAAMKHFEYVISAGGYDVQVPEKIDNYRILRVSVEQPIENVKLAIDRAYELNGWLVLVGHISQGDWYSDAHCREVIEYALSKGLEFVTTQEGINIMGNIAQFGDTKITTDGKIINNGIGLINVNRNKKEYYFDESIGTLDVGQQILLRFAQKTASSGATHLKLIGMFGESGAGRSMIEKSFIFRVDRDNIYDLTSVTNLSTKFVETDITIEKISGKSEFYLLIKKPTANTTISNKWALSIDVLCSTDLNLVDYSIVNF